MGKHKSVEKERSVKQSSKHKHKHKHKEHEGGSKKASSLEASVVHSANAWEDVKFDSNDRKKKFLRLMGAQKQRKHTGSIQIGEKAVTHKRAGVGVEEIGKDLERQFTEGLEHKSSWSRHAGLGCSNENSSPHGEPARPNKDEESEVPHLDDKYTVKFVKSSDQ
ncbi:unnamed protein product [Hydatigera taeniaeformis]|uniref:Small acidic protein n=1 Tax=Hydatigena taeniaeformis TaxID=6205 RepID=A0A0R3X686_HYDTA|nr:unnamed protein product [Hydatigera taeniaeformis]